MIERREPLLDRGDAATVIGGKRDLGDDRGHSDEISGRQRVLERRLGVAVQLVPVGGTRMQRAKQVRLALCKLSLKQVTKEMVITVPFAFLIERHEKEVRPLDLFELACRPLIVEDGVTQRAAHSLEHRGSPQEPESSGAELRQVLGPEVIGHVFAVAAEQLCSREVWCPVVLLT